jgi:chromosome segregation ATPase
LEVFDAEAVYVMVTTPWWILATLVQLTLIGLLVAAYYFHKTGKAKAALAAMQQRLQQHLTQATEHKLKIAEMELQLESLDAFQEMYFELQDQHEKLQSLHEEFTSKANALLSDDDQTKLQHTLQQLQSEKEKLELKLKEVGGALQQILAKQHFAPDQLEAAGRAALAAVDEVEKEVRAIGNVIEQQQRLIEQLHQQIGTLQIEVDAKQTLETAIDQLRQQNNEMGGVVEELKQENQNLHAQIQAMEVKERAGGSHLADEVKCLQQALTEKEQAYAELYKEYVAIEAEYQKIYAKTHKIQA